MSAAVDTRTDARRGSRIVDYRSIGALIRELPLSPAEKKLARFMTRGIWDRRSKQKAFTVKGLWSENKLSEATVRRALPKFQRWGLIERVEREDRYWTRYRIPDLLREAITQPTSEGVLTLTRHHGSSCTRPAGRPRIYATEAERKEAAKAATKRWRQRLRDENSDAEDPPTRQAPRDGNSDGSMNSAPRTSVSANGPSVMETHDGLQLRPTSTTHSSPDGAVVGAAQRQGPGDESPVPDEDQTSASRGWEDVPGEGAVLGREVLLRRIAERYGEQDPDDPIVVEAVVRLEQGIPEEEIDAYLADAFESRWRRLRPEEPPVEDAEPVEEELEVDVDDLEPEGSDEEAFVALANAGDLDRLLAEWRSDQIEEAVS